MNKTITIKKDADIMFNALHQEAFETERCKVTITKKPNLTFNIKAKDKSAFKAGTTSVKKAITVFKKIQQIK
tara:strand:+ start:6915 stop:7130 length:216 start_codon:yes stop_codon:yes gene_type:complete